MNISCENPRIILHPYAVKWILRFRNYTINGIRYELDPVTLRSYMDEFPYRLISPRSINPDLESISDCYITDNCTGECLPLYLVVPCGKCIICGDRKAREWCLRSVCETNYSSNIPFFITLTYSPQNLPTDGVLKSDIQLFMKRLRRNLDRMGYTHNLRYFICAEYGTKSGRAHYHAILWNFPKFPVYDVSFDRYCWDVQRLMEKSWQQGFVYCRPCNQGAVRYCMKYMRKTCVVPHGCNPTFFLSSRRGGGIGYQWAQDHIAFYRNNSSVLDIEITDRYSGDVYKSSIPSYFRTKFYPTISAIVPIEIRRAFDSFVYMLALRREWYHRIKPFKTVDMYPDEKRCYLNYSSVLPNTLKYDNCVVASKHLAKINGVSHVLTLNRLIDRYLAILESYTIPIDLIHEVSACRSIRQHTLNVVMDGTEINVNLLIDRLNKAKNDAIRNERI